MLYWFDGFDQNTLLSNYDFVNNCQTTTLHARTGIQCMWNFGGTLVKGFPISLTTGIVGAALFLGAYQTGVVYPMGLGNGNSPLLTPGINNVGQLYVSYQGNTNPVAGALSNVRIPLNQSHYVEIVGTIGAGGAGSASIYLDGALAVAVSGQNFGTTPINSIICQGQNQWIDDIYFMDTSGPAPWNAPLGNAAVVTQFPTGAGSFTQWTPIPGTNANWQNVALLTPTPATVYNKSSASGNRDSFTYPTFPPTGLPAYQQIIAVMLEEYGQADSAGPCAVQLINRQSGVDAPSSNITLGVGSAYGYAIFEKDVNNGLWLASNLNATESGYLRTV
jgi:hypothetical protein